MPTPKSISEQFDVTPEVEAPAVVVIAPAKAPEPKV